MPIPIFPEDDINNLDVAAVRNTKLNESFVPKLTLLPKLFPP